MQSQSLWRLARRMLWGHKTGYASPASPAGVVWDLAHLD